MREKEAVPFACGNMLYSMGKKLFLGFFMDFFLIWGELWIGVFRVGVIFVWDYFLMVSGIVVVGENYGWDFWGIFG